MKQLITLVLVSLIVGPLVITSPDNQRAVRASAMQPRTGSLYHIYRVDVGGYRLWMACTGTGRPTVLLEAGAGGDASVWGSMLPDPLAKVPAHLSPQFCAYDRAGNGNSDPGPLPRSSQRIVQELHTLLVRAHIPGPYVLVGHSIGGLYVRLYAYTYPLDVIGMVLVDSSSSGQFHPPAAWMLSGLPKSCPAAATNVGCQEALAWKDDVAEERAVLRHRSQPPLDHLPLAVLTAEYHTPDPSWTDAQNKQDYAFWLTLQDALVHLSSNGMHLIARDSGHYIQQDQPDLVLDAIQQVVTAARHHGALALVHTWRCGSGRCP